MKNKIFSLLVFLIIIFSTTNGVAIDKKMISIQGLIPIDLTEDSLWLNRFSDQIRLFEQENESFRVQSDCDVLLIGSSSMRLWKTYKEDLSPLRVVNRGYGGATVRDILYNYRSLTQSVYPRNIIIYIGNDISGKKEDVLVGESYKRYSLLMDRLFADFPHAHIYILSVHITKRCIELKEETLRFNALLKEYASLNSAITFVDVVSVLTDDHQDPIDPYFLSDNLHLSPLGYEQWTALLRGFLLR